MYCLQSKAVGDIQLVSSWSQSLEHLKVSRILVLELPGKLQLKVTRAQKNLLAHGILYIHGLSFYLTLLSLLSVQQALLHQLSDILHLLDLLNASSTVLDPIQYIHKHPNWSPVYYMCWG